MSRASRLRLPALAAGAAMIALVLGACGENMTTPDETDTTATDATTPTVAVNSSVAGFDAQQVYADAAPSVVTIISILGDGGLSGGGGQGSGFVISDSGEIVTNAHVVTDAEDTGASNPSDIHEAKQVYVEFGDHNQVPADIVGFDPNADVALIKVDPDGLDIQPIELGNSDDLAVGQPVAAIGSPFGQQQSLSTGIVSATDRSIDSLTQFKIDGGIQTDASINPGNSGGPLIDADGEVIGIDQQINTTSGGNEGVGFAVPINLAKRSIDQLRDNGEVSYPYLGVATMTLFPQLAERLGVDTDHGVLITQVNPGSPADEAGLKAGNDRFRFQAQQVIGGGDVIVEADGDQLEQDGDLATAILDKEPGDTVTLKIIRDGKTEDVDVTLGDRNDAESG
ncbi:MAG: trypsin-like peptidase domain-containing protein [Solirubrobacterales bacterium]|nr:trypsin-like peptidase domain-containing protein [Solirubrobacterales bacterium]MCO5326353.1 trypsin-like peptidase domain-containing protein [Solirubrobacterales bacterium]